MTDVPVYKKKDFISDQEVKWCPGCGDYAILSSIQMALTKIGKKKEDLVFVSGIGCSSRFPYYVETYGMHSIHGRATAIASGLKLHNPELEVFVVTGDGDGLAIGGNHMIHTLRRNIGLRVIMFNNEIYGLTKGQYSPTSAMGLVTKSTPYGVVDRPFIPAALALGAGATFIARTIDADPKQITDVVVEACQHKGVAFIEVLQNCVIFNDGAHDEVTNKDRRDDTTVRLEHGKPMIFGKDRNKGLMLKGFNPVIVTIGENGITEKDLIVHDATDYNVASMLTRLSRPEFPLPLGVFRNVEAPSYDEEVQKQIENVTKKKGKGDMVSFLKSGETWQVK
ncbi:MAG: 2-oxoacid:ferredoxin oxidoreductase subunit beta [Bdellovibrio sp.]|nr:2-oxoacid:ferredoxin oxidoreductase subunit beta [Bdellovibrio sp.]